VVAGGPWRAWEHQNGSQFYALSRRLPGTVPVFDFWNRKLKKATFHADPPEPNEEKKSLQFYAFGEQVAPDCTQPPTRSQLHAATCA
jgi:hypothetical protein